MNPAFLLSSRKLSRRAALARLGAGGLALALAARVHPSLGQQGTPVVLPREVPPVLQGWVEGWQNIDPAQIASAYAEGAVVEIVPFGTVLVGPNEIEEYFTEYFAAFRAPAATITTAFATEDRAGAEWIFQGQYTGQLPGLPPGEGQPVSAQGASIMVLAEGQIVEERIYSDLAGLLSQIGFGPLVPDGTPSVATPAG